MKALADALVTNCTLTDINLASNLMADEGCKAVVPRKVFVVVA